MSVGLIIDNNLNIVPKIGKKRQNLINFGGGKESVKNLQKNIYHIFSNQIQ